jgi:hypothetical protein
MSNPEIPLREAAGAIGQMSSTDVQQALRNVKEKRNARSQMEMLRQQDELASLELDQAAYQLAGEAEGKGDLTRAAQWYTAAALNDFGDASLKLAKVLDALAEKHLRARGANPATREELDLVSEACRWYSDALVAGEAEAQELLEKLIERHLGKSRTSSFHPETAEPDARPGSAPHQSPEPSDHMTTGADEPAIADLPAPRIPSRRSQ